MMKSTDHTRKSNSRAGCRTGFWQKFQRDERGSVAIWVGITLTVFIGCAGMAVDTARGYMVKAQLSQALDAAALAGAKSLGNGHVKEDIDMFFKANFPAQQLGATVTGPVLDPVNPDAADNTANTIKLTATAKIDTTLMAVLGFKTMTVGAAATAIRGLQGLDLVISIDVSGSMCMTSACDKIKAAQKAAKDLIDTVYGTDSMPKVLNIGTPPVAYNILNIGVVPWNSKVNVTYNKKHASYAAYTGATKITANVPTFTNPLTGLPQNFYWLANNSEVRLLSDPGPNWKGGVYARYIDTGLDKNDDADMKLGYGTYGGKGWMAYEPITTLMGEPLDKNVGPNGEDYSAKPAAQKYLDKWDLATGGKYPPTGATTTNWYSADPNWNRNCYGAYYNDKLTDPKDHPISVPDTPTWWTPSYPIKETSGASPTDFSFAGKDDAECRPAPTQGIFPLTPVKNATDKALVKSAVDQLYTGTQLSGGTGAEQGLFWSWEVLMPGMPFNEAKASVPFNRTQAIVLLTDGESTGFNGDAYKAVFGPDTAANSTAAHGSLVSNVNKCGTTNQPFTVNNNLNGRLYALAQSIKGADPTKGVKIFVVQYQAPDASLTDLLQLVASKCGSPYYFRADNDTAMAAAFKTIAIELSVLRLQQ